MLAEVALVLGGEVAAPGSGGLEFVGGGLEEGDGVGVGDAFEI